jgi:hypothetical protein
MTAELTKKRYAEYLQRLTAVAGTDNLASVEAMIKAVEGLKRADGAPLIPTTKRNFYIALAHATKATAPIAHAAYKKKYEAINKAVKEDKTAKPAAKSWTDLQLKAGKFVADESEPLGNRILIGLLFGDAPGRLDYNNLLIHPDMTDHAGNYIHLAKTAGESHLVIQEHKTKKTYGTLYRSITPATFALLKLWQRDTPSETLFKMSENNLGRFITRLLERMTGEHLSINDLRHAYVTEMRKGDMSKHDVEEITDKMGHSLTTNYLYRR